MKRSLVLMLALLLSVWGFSQEKRRMDDLNTAGNDFQVNFDGSVTIQGEKFESMVAWHESDKFRLEGRRCLSHDRTLS